MAFRKAGGYLEGFKGEQVSFQDRFARCGQASAVLIKEHDIACLMPLC